MSWITESNRQKHFWYAIPCGFLLTILFVAGLAAGMEFKDKSYGDKWDWLYFLATILGGLVGQIIQGIALLLMWKGGVI
jgi:cytochrome bd-type quinol oxidase subunit 2